MEQIEDFAPYTVALGLDISALKESMRNKKWEEAHQIAKRMMHCLNRANTYATTKIAEEANKARELR